MAAIIIMAIITTAPILQIFSFIIFPFNRRLLYRVNTAPFAKIQLVSIMKANTFTPGDTFVYRIFLRGDRTTLSVSTATNNLNLFHSLLSGVFYKGQEANCEEKCQDQKNNFISDSHSSTSFLGLFDIRSIT